MEKVSVKVWEKPHEINVYQKSKSVWIASGAYMNENLTVKDSSRNSAVRAWCDAARYKGN